MKAELITSFGDYHSPIDWQTELVEELARAVAREERERRAATGDVTNEPGRAAEAEVRAVMSEWADAVRTRDVDALCRLVSEDVVMLMPRSAPLRGREAARSLYATLFATVAIEQQFEVAQIDIAGGRAVAWGRDTVTVVDLETRQIRDRASGHGLTVFRREEDGRWRVTHAINNMAREDSSSG